MTYWSWGPVALDCGRPLVVGLNKWDRVEESSHHDRVKREVERRLRFIPDVSVLRVSALTGRGTRQLVRAALEWAEEGDLIIMLALGGSEPIIERLGA